MGNVDPDTEALEVVCTSLMNVYVFHADGSLYGPWPIQASDWLYGACPALGDLDGDGDIEIVIGTEWGIQAWHHDGTEIFYHNLFYYDDFFPRVYEFPVLSDLDKDGDLEIILGKIDGNLYIFHHDGSDFSYNSFTWPKATGGAIKSTPALADLDGDSELEIVVGSEDGYMYAWNLDGSDVDSHWPIHIGRPIRSSPAIGDIDNRSNHDLEVVIGSEGKVYAWHQDGTPVSGNWPVSTPVYTSFVYTSPGLADLNGNGDLEILIHDRERSLEILKHDGSRVSGWNPPDSLELSSDSPIIGDLNGDFSPEIIIHS